MARHGSGRRNGLSGRTKKLDSELWQQDVDQQNGTRGSFRFPPDRRHQKRSTDVLRKPDNCKSYRHSPRDHHMINDLWYKNAIVYCLSVGTYMDADGDGIGDFPGLVRRLDYLHGLGVTALWLMPFQPSPGRD